MAAPTATDPAPAVVEIGPDAVSPDEELLAAPGMPRGVVALLTALAVIVLAVAVAGRGRGGEPATPTPDAGPLPIVEDSRLLWAGPPQDPVTCPPSISCVVEARVPPGLRAAVDERLGVVSVRDRFAVVQTDPRGLYYCHIDLTVATGELRVRIWRASILRGDRPVEELTRAGDEVVATVAVLTPEGFLVRLTLDGRAVPPLRTLQALAADPRLRQWQP